MSAQTDLISQIEILPNAKGFVKYAKKSPIVGRFLLIREMTDSAGKRRLTGLDFTDMRIQGSDLLANKNEDLVVSAQNTNIFRCTRFIQVPAKIRIEVRSRYVLRNSSEAL